MYYFIQPEPVLFTLAHFLFDLLLFSQLVKQLFWKDPFILIFIDIYEHVLDIFIRFTERLAIGICFNDAQCLKMLIPVVVFSCYNSEPCGHYLRYPNDRLNVKLKDCNR